MTCHIPPGLQKILDARDANLFISKVKLKEIAKSPYSAIWRIGQCGYVDERSELGYRIEGLRDGGCDGFENVPDPALIKSPCTTNNPSFPIKIKDNPLVKDRDGKVVGKIVEDENPYKCKTEPVTKDEKITSDNFSNFKKAVDNNEIKIPKEYHLVRAEAAAGNRLEKQDQEFEKPELYEPITKVEWSAFFGIVVIVILALVTLGFVIYG